MIGLGLKALYVAGVRWPLGYANAFRICPTSTDPTGPTPHDMGVVCCHRCGKLA